MQEVSKRVKNVQRYCLTGWNYPLLESENAIQRLLRFSVINCQQRTEGMGIKGIYTYAYNLYYVARYGIISKRVAENLKSLSLSVKANPVKSLKIGA